MADSVDMSGGRGTGVGVRGVAVEVLSAVELFLDLGFYPTDNPSGQKNYLETEKTASLISFGILLLFGSTPSISTCRCVLEVR
jgi:hypothetical protein